MVPRPEEIARIVILDAKLLKDNSHKAYAKRIGVISVCPSAHNPLFVITLRHGRHTHTHMRTHTHTQPRAFLLCYRLWRGRLIPIFNSTQSNTKLRGGLGAGLCCTMLLSGTTPVLNYPLIPCSFSITHWPNKVCFSNKKEQQRNTESRFCATAVPHNPRHCVFVSGKLSVMEVIGPVCGLKGALCRFGEDIFNLMREIFIDWFF